MNKVIGYEGTAEDRSNRWLSMLMLKKSEEVFKGTSDEKELKVREQDKRIYQRFLSEYAKAA